MLEQTAHEQTAGAILPDALTDSITGRFSPNPIPTFLPQLLPDVVIAEDGRLRSAARLLAAGAARAARTAVQASPPALEEA